MSGGPYGAGGCYVKEIATRQGSSSSMVRRGPGHHLRASLREHSLLFHTLRPSSSATCYTPLASVGSVSTTEQPRS